MTVGIESEFLLEEELSAMEFVSGDQVTFNTTVFDVADRSNVSGVTVEYIWDFGNSNQTIGTAVTDAEGMLHSPGHSKSSTRRLRPTDVCC